ncbi:hypothetical protein FHS85_001966 [Rhodoligotrophos appendicifer]|uniref:hypothetical protein n=1 Tax=Rhodoligotrophos appendicifer TaxID=987056 RepID=UPI00118587BE|nr:hypothetical protein [Rhodoligotrophos appendicifer]
MAMLKIPDERASQLKRLSRHHGKPMTEVLGSLIAQELEKEGLSRDMPGLGAEVVKTNVGLRIAITVENITTAGLNVSEAIGLANAIDQISHKAGRASVSFKSTSDKMEVDRVGSAVRLAIHDDLTETAAKRVMPVSIAQEFAHQIRLAAERAA